MPSASVAAAGAGLALMFALFPYGAGWGDQPTSVVSNLLWMWKHAKEWEHCQLVPLISLFIIWLDREKLRDVPWEGQISGLYLFLLGMGLFWVGYLIDIVVFSFLVFHLMIGATAVWLFGWPLLRAVFFPYAFLFFAWPMPFLEATIAFPLRDIMARFSHGFLNLIGLDVLRVGTSIVSAPDPVRGLAQGARFALDVADPCSGIRSLFALTMVSALFAYFGTTKDDTLAGWRKQVAGGPFWQRGCVEFLAFFTDHWRGWLVFLSAAPFAVLGNFCRILMLTFGTLLLGSKVAIGDLEHPSTYHMASGFLVFGVALGGMFTWGWFLNEGCKTLIERSKGLYAVIGAVKSPPQPGKEF
ncbi:MAG: exosortase/archaeosortase family protein [Candidatus Methylacidiphilales bacterium]|nr:exosortase/archaeosortase family protein [Candidatus Methylacidiphilales bacterium]